MLKDKLIEPLTVKSKDNRLKKKKHQNIQGFWNNYERYNIHTCDEIMKEEDREKGAEELFETIMTKNSPN